MKDSPCRLINTKQGIKAEDLRLRQFRCTNDRPKTAKGKPLPHPLQWEWEAQRHVRNLRQQFRQGDLVILHMPESARHGTLAGVLHLRAAVLNSQRIAALEVVAVSQDFRNPKPPHVADELITQALATLRSDTPDTITETLMTALIHIENMPSMRFAQRHGFEPLASVAEAENGYVPWACHI